MALPSRNATLLPTVVSPSGGRRDRTTSYAKARHSAGGQIAPATATCLPSNTGGATALNAWTEIAAEHHASTIESRNLPMDRPGLPVVGQQQTVDIIQSIRYTPRRQPSSACTRRECRCGRRRLGCRTCSPVLARKASLDHAHRDRARKPAVKLRTGLRPVPQDFAVVLVARIAGLGLEVVVGQQIVAPAQLFAIRLPLAERFQRPFLNLLDLVGHLPDADKAFGLGILSAQHNDAVCRLASRSRGPTHSRRARFATLRLAVTDNHENHFALEHM